MANLGSVVSHRKRYCTLCVLTPKLEETQTLQAHRCGVLSSVPPSLVTVDVAISFLFNNLPLVIFNVSLVFCVKLSNVTDDLPAFESFRMAGSSRIRNAFPA